VGSGYRPSNCSQPITSLSTTSKAATGSTNRQAAGGRELFDGAETVDLDPAHPSHQPRPGGESVASCDSPMAGLRTARSIHLRHTPALKPHAPRLRMPTQNAGSSPLQTAPDRHVRVGFPLVRPGSCRLSGRAARVVWWSVQWGSGITGHTNDGPSLVVIAPASIADSTSPAESKSPDPFASKPASAEA
jgi:hypothetical protein